MEATKKRKIENGEEYNHLFPKPLFLDPTIKKGATVSDTVRFIPKVVRETLKQTALLAPILKGDSVHDTCRNIWEFVYKHIAYKKDQDGKEQIRSPARAWHDRFQGVDCDCYTVFISSILSNLKIKHKLRITKYSQDHFQHIYPIVPTSDGKHITIDCVVDRFNYEEPYTEKQDTKMELEYLNGVPSTTNVDVQDLMGWEEMNGEDDLGKIKFKMTQPPGSGDHSKKGKLKNLIHKGLHLTNRLNPATALIREGILLSMKLNLFKVAQRLKYAYLSNDEAKKKEIDMGKFDKLKKVKDKLEKIFYDAGGKPENLKKAILTGKGNKGGRHDVNGLGYLPDDMSGMDENTPSQTLLGLDMYQSEGFGELGSATAAAASITAATGIIGAIAGLLKGIGNMFPKKSKEGADFENTDSKPGDGTSTAEVSQSASDVKVTNSDDGSSKTLSTSNSSGSATNDTGGDNQRSLMKSTDTSSSSDTSSTDTSNTDKPPTFWEKNKKWIKPTAIGITGLGLVFLGVKMLHKPKPPVQAQVATPQLSGVKRGRKKRKGGDKGKKKQAVAYM